MENTFNLPKFAAVAYVINPQTGYFEKSAQQPAAMPCNAMPFELSHEITRGEQIEPNAEQCLTLREVKKDNGSKRIFTGLQPVPFDNWHIGNKYSPTAKKGKKSDILFYFYPTNNRMVAFYFSGYHSNNRDLRNRFAVNVIPQLRKMYNL